MTERTTELLVNCALIAAILALCAAGYCYAGALS